MQIKSSLILFRYMWSFRFKQFLIVLLLWGCQTFYVIDYEKKEDNGKGMGIVGFSLYLNKENKLYNYRCPSCFSFSIASKNQKEKSISKFIPILYRTTEVKGGTANHQNVWGISDSPFIALLLPEDKLKDIYLSNFHVRFDGKLRVSGQVILNPTQSVNVLNLTPEPGKIKYLGLFRVNLDKVDGSSNKSQVSFMINIEKDKTDTFGSLAGEFVDRGYFDTQNNALGNEIRFYKEFLNSHKEGYWHDQAEQKLKELALKK